MIRITIHAPRHDNLGVYAPDRGASYATANRAKVEAAFPAYTRIEAIGMWRGGIDKLDLYTVDADGAADVRAALTVARGIARDMAQDSVYVTVQDSRGIHAAYVRPHSDARELAAGLGYPTRVPAVFGAAVGVR